MLLTGNQFNDSEFALKMETVDSEKVTFFGLAFKTIVVHSVTYFACGIVAFIMLDYENKFADPNVRIFMRQTKEPIVMAGPLFQPIRGFLFTLAFYPLRSVLFGKQHGWIVMWTVFVTIGILSTFGPSPGSVEGVIYTIFPIRQQLLGMTEVLAQSLLLSVILCYWVNHPKRHWLSWLLGLLFFVAMLLPTLGLLFDRGQ